MKKLKLYLSASLSNKELNNTISEKLESRNIKMLLPHELENLKKFAGKSHYKYPKAVFHECVMAMEESDAALLIFDAYGRDCSWEAGWYASRKKPLIGFVSDTTYFMKDWMVKGGINALITTNKTIYRHLLEDPILCSGDIFLIKSLNELGSLIIKILRKGREIKGKNIRYYMRNTNYYVDTYLRKIIQDTGGTEYKKKPILKKQIKGLEEEMLFLQRKPNDEYFNGKGYSGISQLLNFQGDF